MIRKVLLIFAMLMLVVQLFRPGRNISTSASPNAIEANYKVPKEIGVLLRRSCYDCHSNNTIYPWYSNIQPFSWWLQSHVNDGKEELNFDQFNSYNIKKKKHKLDEIVEVIEKDEMPLSSYTLVHRKAVLSAPDKDKIIAWAKGLNNAIN
ncbi:heme-binding domain-containing protein [Pedobacter caeni]|uniref:Haem-binding domain-containing protein n=1 Tax=Pedobacter caeni TaxID=288992 RepID=A0A1M5BZG6_9SPHI|nr:heme-binding domain-containing protein [Pedobacter caeni]SHF47879.1 Haem-binding domain-containing protein [Pedobacter caeni]